MLDKSLMELFDISTDQKSTWNAVRLTFRVKLFTFYAESQKSVKLRIT
jgi:hypothetical protein